jgi:4-amino-4-deoxy-L-arabinose transferase-like glycosyltransferase
MDLLIGVLKDGVRITSFVLVMMMIIEFVNVQTRGSWSRLLKQKGWLQVVLAALLGIVPGCLGTYVVVSLFTHRMVSLGAMTAALIATFGDEAFIMMSMVPVLPVENLIALFISTLSIAVVVGFIINIFSKKKQISDFDSYEFHVHQDKIDCVSFNPRVIYNQLRNIIFSRAILLFGTVLVLVGLVTSQLGHDHSHEASIITEDEHQHETEELEVEYVSCDDSEDDNHHSCSREGEYIVRNEVDAELEVVNILDHEEHHEGEHEEHNHNSEGHNHESEEAHHAEHAHEDHIDWITITFLITTLFAFVMLLLCTDHFLMEHLWEHIIKKHFLKVLLWTMAALLIIGIMDEFVETKEWIHDNKWIVLVIAVLVGLIPASGPHLVFVSGFVTGAVPFSILLASSISQDGHGALPLFAESKKNFFLVKAINVAVGLLVGGAMLMAGY